MTVASLRLKNITGRKESDEVLYRDVDGGLGDGHAGEDEAASPAELASSGPPDTLLEAEQDISGLNTLITPRDSALVFDAICLEKVIESPRPPKKRRGIRAPAFGNRG